ncbi:tetratricopeptide repeat protein [Methylomarinum vadi]|uniref:tetratricopeptide repeat protein n=1 Tax=Methylomarinum vadi TaxID=438855 RepID=UPI000ACA4431|nr:tetratricopeptide repeat protein [Methylomarinum vadi]
MPFLILQVGCSEFYGYQPPAPVYGGQVTNPYEDELARTYPDTSLSQPGSSPSATSQDLGTQELEPLPKENVSVPPRPQSPAVIALMSESDRNQRAGDLDSAVAVLERALRIDPRNPTLTYKLAALRLKQEKPRLAEDLAKKAALLAAGDGALKRKSWLLICEARRRQQNYQGAKEAQIKAQSFGNP